jgi:hypothetical protein
MRNLRPLALVCLLAAACSTASGRPAGMTQPQLEVRLASGSPFFGSGRTAGVTFDVVVANTSAIPFNVRRVELSTPNAIEYGIAPTERLFNDAVAPGQQRTFAIPATAITTVNRIQQTEPLMVRLVMELEHDGKRWREIILSRGVD